MAPTAPTVVIFVRHGQTPSTGKSPARPRRRACPGRQGPAQAQAVAERAQGPQGHHRALRVAAAAHARDRSSRSPRHSASDVRSTRACSSATSATGPARTSPSCASCRSGRPCSATRRASDFPAARASARWQRVCRRLSTATAPRIRARTVVAVSHADPIKAAAATALGVPLDLFQRIDISPCSMTVDRLYERRTVRALRESGDVLSERELRVHRAPTSSPSAPSARPGRRVFLLQAAGGRHGRDAQAREATSRRAERSDVRTTRKTSPRRRCSRRRLTSSCDHRSRWRGSSARWVWATSTRSTASCSTRSKLSPSTRTASRRRTGGTRPHPLDSHPGAGARDPRDRSRRGRASAVPAVRPSPRSQPATRVRRRTATTHPSARASSPRGEVVVEGRMPWSSNATLLVTVTCGDDEMRARSTSPRAASARCGTTRRGCGDARSRPMSSSEALGWELVPETIGRVDAPMGQGLAATLRRRRRLRAALLHPDRDDESHHDRLRQMCVFDLVINNADRKGGHCLLTPDGAIFGIDHGLYVPDLPRACARSSGTSAASPIPDAWRADLRACRRHRSGRARRTARSRSGDRRVPSAAARGRRSALRSHLSARTIGTTHGPTYDRFRDELIDRGDLDELTRFVDRLTEQDDWAELVYVRDDCRAAAARGKQLWPVTAYVNYVLAFRGPGDVRGRSDRRRRRTRRGRGRAVRIRTAHRGGGVHPRLGRTRRRTSAAVPPSSLFAHECVLHGADLTRNSDADGSILDIPAGARGTWEPAYEVAIYKLEKAEFPAPAMPATGRLERSLSLSGADFEADDETTDRRPRRTARDHRALGRRVERPRRRQPASAATSRARCVRSASPACASPRSLPPTRSRTWRGPARRAARTADAVARRPDASPRGGPRPPWSTSATTGRSPQTNSKSPSTRCAGISGTKAPTDTAGRCASPSRIRPNGLGSDALDAD